MSQRPFLRGRFEDLPAPGARRLLARVVRRAPERWAHRHVHSCVESLTSLLGQRPS